MITKTLNLDEAYQTLFDDVRKASDGAISVDNLEAYYGSIEEIAALDPKFLRLPLDEPLFEIDANTRKITVPAEFKSNGVSVQKDHLAEIIFFRIARFFDYTDLATCDIVINWKMGSKEGKTTRFIKFEEPFLVDEVQTNGIIFGWPINDIVTDKSGALTFAVEFFKKDGVGDDAKIIYRFNTLPTSVNIKDGLVISEDAKVYELDNDIIRTLVNSKFGEGTAAVGDIIWLTGNGQGLVVGEGIAPDVDFEDFAATINLDTVITDGVPSSIPVNFYAEGYVDEGTKIRYTTESGASLSATPIKVVRPRIQAEYDANSGLLYYASAIAEEPLSAEAVAAAVAAEEELWITGPLEEDLRYFKMDNNALKEATDTDLATWGKENAVELFVIAAMITADKAGPYLIKAQGYKEGQKRDDNGELMYDDNDEPLYEKIGNGDVRATATVTVPAVVAPSAIEVSVSELTSVDTGYSFNEEQTQNVMFLNAEDQGVISASAVVDDFGALQFAWKKQVREPEYDAHGEIIDDGFDPISDTTVAFQDTNSSELEVEAPGQYKVSVVNFLNGASADAVDSVAITASRIAGKITSVTPKWAVGAENTSNSKINVATRSPNYNSNANQLANRKLTLFLEDVVIEDGGQVGTLEYAWYIPVYEEDNEGLRVIVDKTMIPNKTNPFYTVEGGDIEVIPEVRNNYNGSIYTYTLDPIAVNDSAT